MKYDVFGWKKQWEAEIGIHLVRQTLMKAMRLEEAYLQVKKDWFGCRKWTKAKIKLICMSSGRQTCQVVPGSPPECVK